MNIREFAKPVTAKSLNESLAQKFGTKLRLENYSLQQLQDARNKLRTKLSQIEMSESFSSVNKTDAYQKNKLILDILNTEISERGDIEDSAISEKAVSQSQQQAAGIALKHKREGTRPTKGSASAEMMNMSTAELEKIAGTEHSGLPDKVGEGKYKSDAQRRAIHANKSKKESVVKEGAEDQAEIVMAAKDMVNKVTSWMEDTSEMQTESMLDLADSIRDELGQETSQQFVDSIKPSLESLYTAMESTRQVLTNGVGMLTGEAEPMDTMGVEPEDDMDMEPIDDIGGEVDSVPTDDQGFAAAGAASGGDDEAGRARRESVDPRKLGRILSGSKKK